MSTFRFIVPGCAADRRPFFQPRVVTLDPRHPNRSSYFVSDGQLIVAVDTVTGGVQLIADGTPAPAGGGGGGGGGGGSAATATATAMNESSRFVDVTAMRCTSDHRSLYVCDAGGYGGGGGGGNEQDSCQSLRVVDLSSTLGGGGGGSGGGDNKIITVQHPTRTVWSEPVNFAPESTPGRHGGNEPSKMGRFTSLCFYRRDQRISIQGGTGSMFNSADEKNKMAKKGPVRVTQDGRVYFGTKNGVYTMDVKRPLPFITAPPAPPAPSINSQNMKLIGSSDDIDELISSPEAPRYFYPWIAFSLSIGGIECTPSGVLIFSCTNTHSVYAVDPLSCDPAYGITTTCQIISGAACSGGSDKSGYQDGSDLSTMYDDPCSMSMCDTMQCVYVGDRGPTSRRIRKLQLLSKWFC